MLHLFPTLVMDSVSEKKDIGDRKSRKSRSERNVAWMPFNQRLPNILEVGKVPLDLTNIFCVRQTARVLESHKAIMSKRCRHWWVQTSSAVRKEAGAGKKKLQAAL